MYYCIIFAHFHLHKLNMWFCAVIISIVCLTWLAWFTCISQITCIACNTWIIRISCITCITRQMIWRWESNKKIENIVMKIAQIRFELSTNRKHKTPWLCVNPTFIEAGRNQNLKEKQRWATQRKPARTAQDLRRFLSSCSTSLISTLYCFDCSGDSWASWGQCGFQPRGGFCRLCWRRSTTH